jgi:Flp pilus assembly protein TadB
MTQTRLKETVTAQRLISPKPSESRLGRERARSASSSPQNVADLNPYTPKELKYLWTLWDEAQRHQQPGLRYLNLYIGAVGVILTGWLINGMGLSFSKPLGGILMVVGALTGAWYCLKSLRQQRQSGPGR